MRSKLAAIGKELVHEVIRNLLSSTKKKTSKAKRNKPHHGKRVEERKVNLDK